MTTVYRTLQRAKASEVQDQAAQDAPESPREDADLKASPPPSALRTTGTAPATDKATREKRRASARKWHVIQGSRAHPDTAVVIVGSYTTKRSALTALRRMRRTGLGAGDPDTEVAVRKDDQITTWTSYDVTAGKTVTHHDPPGQDSR